MDFSIVDITINGQKSGVVTDSLPVVYLRTEGVPQSYRLWVNRGEACLFDSGRKRYESPFLIMQLRLSPKTSYCVHVEAWKEEVRDTAVMTFETGFLGQPWQANWIEPQQERAVRETQIHFYEIFRPWPEPENDGARLRPGQLLRRRFRLTQLPERAYLYATAHGVYHLRLNGMPVSNSRLAPGITPYLHYLYYQSYDIRSMLLEGDNELEVELCDGWWIGRIGLSGDSCQYGDRLGFLAQLELDDQIIGTDQDWECRESYIRYSDLYVGEKWDLTEPLKPWRPCCIANYPMDNLVAQPIPAVQVLKELDGKLFRTPKGSLVADFGQAVAGIIWLEADLQKGTEIVLEHSETLDQNGEFFRNIIGRNKQQRDKVKASAGHLAFAPQHTYHGFRYVRIQGVSESEIQSVKALVLGTPLQQEGDFSCSDAKLNRLQENICWSILGNMVSIPTDCPQREKMGWTGDIQVFTKTGCFQKNLLPFLSAWLDGLRVEQLDSGEVPLISPNFPRTDAMQRETGGENTSSAWGDACVLVPWYLYQCTGDTKVLRDNLPMMEKWLVFIARAAGKKPENFDTLTPQQQARSPYLWRSGHHFGDWMIPSMSADPAEISRGSALTGPVVASCFYAITMRAWIGVLEALLSEKEDSLLRAKHKAACELLEKVCAAVRDEYISPDGHVTGELQGVYVLALYSGVVQGKQKKMVADRLAQMIQANGGRLDTGFVSTPYLLDVLCDNGYSQLAYQLLFSEEPPSWLYQVKMGATTIWEKWQAILPDGTVTASSMNHYALGSVGDWIYRRIGGIEAAVPGYRKVRFAPEVNCGLLWCRCTKQTAFGCVSCFWEKTPEGTRIQLQTPVEAELVFEDRREQLQPGSYSILL